MAESGKDDTGEGKDGNPKLRVERNRLPHPDGGSHDLVKTAATVLQSVL